MRFSWMLLGLGLACIAAGQSVISNTQSVFERFSVARFAGMLQDSVQNMATDAGGNIYVSGTTWSPDFPVKNAAQPRMGDRIMRSVDRGATWTALADPLVAAPLTIQPSPSTPTTLFAGGLGGIAKSTDGGQSWRLVYSQPNTDPTPNRQLAALSIAIMPENPSRCSRS